MHPTLQALASGTSRTIDLRNRMADAFALTEDEREARLGNGQTVLGNRIAFVLRFTGPAGATRMVAPGSYEITERGRTLLDLSPDDAASAVLRTGPAASGSEKAADTHSTVPDPEPVSRLLPPAERLEIVKREIHTTLAIELLEGVRSLAAAAFERLILRLLRQMGYGVHSIHKGAAGDEGIDGILYEDRLGLDRVYIQAKRYKADNLVGPSKVREFVGALTNAGAVKGVFATTSAFTVAARDALPKGSNSARIVLIDGTELAKLMIEHDVGVQTVDIIRLQRLDLQPFENGDPT